VPKGRRGLSEDRRTGLADRLLRIGRAELGRYYDTKPPGVGDGLDRADGLEGGLPGRYDRHVGREVPKLPKEAGGAATRGGLSLAIPVRFALGRVRDVHVVEVKAGVSNAAGEVLTRESGEGALPGLLVT
jgi:hypothetical protein